MDYGKFDSLDELLKGYNQLEKSFTQKCQQLAETERELHAKRDERNVSEQLAETSLGTNGQPSPSNNSGEVQQAHSTTVDSVETVPQDAGHDAAPALVDPAPMHTNPTDEELQQYLLSNPEFAQKLLQSQQPEFAPAVMCGGGNVTLMPPSRPKTIKEASLMAKELFKK